MEYLPYGRQDITDEDLAAVAEALRKPLITQGPGVDAFEEQLAAAVGAKFAVAYNSGTAALHAAYFAAGLGSGDAVVTTPITFAATANAALYLGAKVAFADVHAATGQLDPRDAEAQALPRTKIVAPVHYTGHVADMEAFADLGRRKGWIVVEDAAHALGAQYTDRAGKSHRVGSCAHSAMCCFSFHPVKHITTGEGGAVTTNDPRLAKELKRFRTHGITRDRSELKNDEGDWYYEQHNLGFNYRISDVLCALGSSQLKRLQAIVDKRREIAAQYDKAFAETDVRWVTSPGNSRGSYHLYVARVPASERRRIFDALRAAKIGVNVHYIPVYRHPYYRAHGFASTALPNADLLYSECISLPMFPGLSPQDVDRVVSELSGLMERAAR